MGLPVVALPISVKPEREGQHLAGDGEGRASGSCLSRFPALPISVKPEREGQNVAGRLAMGLPVALPIIVKPEREGRAIGSCFRGSGHRGSGLALPERSRSLGNRLARGGRASGPCFRGSGPAHQRQARTGRPAPSR